MSDKDEGIIISVRIYKWQKELLERQPINKSQLIRDLLTQYFKGSGNVDEIDKYFIELEEIKKELSNVRKIFEEGKKFIEIINQGLATLDKLEKRVHEIESELLERYEQLKKAKQEDEESKLKELIEEAFKPVLEYPRGVDGWAEDKGTHTFNVRFSKVLPKMAKERGIKLDLKKAKEIIQKYYPDIAKYLS